MKPDLNKINDLLVKFLRKEFKWCKFEIDNDINKDKKYLVNIMLREGDFDPLVKGSKTFVEVLANRGSSSYIDELDHADIHSGTAGKKLSPDAINVFSKIVIFIRNYLLPFCGSKGEVEFGFYVGHYYKNTKPAGSIPKPTKIEHKTAKKPKRRDLVEAIINKVRFYSNENS